MPQPPPVTPEVLDLDPHRLRQAEALLERWVEIDRVPAAALVLGRRDRSLPPRWFGRQRPGPGTPALRADALFLVASITKPVTATAVMLLVERGIVGLQDRVADHLPEFGRNGKEEVRILHLLTHTSGLPDMLPENLRLRREHQPLSAFYERTCRLAPVFRAGTAVNYQSMGFAVLAELVHQASGRLLPEFLAQEVFTPLGMHGTSLGCTGQRRDRVAAVRIRQRSKGPTGAGTVSTGSAWASPGAAW
jgi:CubicO group peptidase (beta-lactamase class C family)